MTTARTHGSYDTTHCIATPILNGTVYPPWLVPSTHPTRYQGPSTPWLEPARQCPDSGVHAAPGYGIGLAHAYSGTMALDIDSWDRAAFELMLKGIDLQALYDAPDAVVIDSGRQGHGKLLYAMQFGLALPSKKVSIEGTTIYELRCATSNGLTVQDVLPPSIHPDTHQPYRWAGRGHWSRLPVLPMPLLDLWQSLLTLDRPVDNPIVSATVEWDLLEPATLAIDADCSREDWITVGMALHYAGTQSGEIERAYNLWNQWSQRSEAKYPGEREVLQQWASFKTSKPTSVKMGSLFKLAREAGWSKPVPDIGTLFSAVGPMQDVAVMSDIKTPPPNLDLDLVPEVLRTRAREVGEHVGVTPWFPCSRAWRPSAGLWMPGFAWS